MSADPTACIICEVPSQETSFCAHCETSYCDGCWTKQPLHRGKSSHRRIDATRWYRIREILEPPVKEQDLEELHNQDEATKWFGVEKNEQSGETDFDETDRFVSLLASSLRQAGTRRYPQLVSFIGDTSKYED